MADVQIIKANIYEYKRNHNANSRASLLLISHESMRKNIMIVIVDNQLSKAVVTNMGSEVGSPINAGLRHLSDKGFYDQIYKNSNSVDISTAKGVDGMLDLIRIGTSNHDVVLSIMKIIRSGQVPEILNPDTVTYTTWGEWE